MPIFILIGKEILLVWTKSALIMSFPARTINVTPHNYVVGGDLNLPCTSLASALSDCAQKFFQAELIFPKISFKCQSPT